MAHWLGESDDRFYVDGEETPSLVGTGMEDYFTDAWNLRLFTNLRAGVSIYEPRGPDQRATMYRWHIADPITFTSDRIPLDPWGQPFQFVRPGVRNPQGFDVWSFHGNSRAPAVWIGNWEHR